MPAPKNTVKAALNKGDLQIGLWLALASPVVAEMAAHAGFDWCLIDGEHGPNDVSSVLSQLQALEAGGTPAVVRVPVAQDWVLKRMLDMGVQTFLIPMIETAAEAEAAAKACRYPPSGTRGVGSALARASHYNSTTDYLETANAEICVIVQVESGAALANIADIAAVDGVDAVFIGPSDLAADMGFLGKADEPEVVRAIEAGFAAIKSSGKPSGIIAFNPGELPYYKGQGAQFIGVGADTVLFSSALKSRVLDARKSLEIL